MQFRLTKTIKILLIINVVLFIIQKTSDMYMGGDFVGTFGLTPQKAVLQFWIWQLGTYAFLHGDVMHLFINMLMLVFIGTEIEIAWGRSRFLRYYFFCAVSAGVVYLILQLMVHSDLRTPMVGASGAIYGLLMAYGIMFGERILLFMLIFPMKAKHFIWVLAGIEFMSTFFSGHSRGLSAVAHLAGMGAGFFYLWAQTFLAQRARQEKVRKPSGRDRKHLKLVINNDPNKSKKEFEKKEDDDQNGGPKTWH
jgi:membrane associated rhomboid family serine protease